jgi:geranylgeranyl reductase family protein
VDVVLVDKSAFPRAKVCGDGLTPRAVKQLIRLGIDISDESSWPRNTGLRVYGGVFRPGNGLELPWPQLKEFPAFGLVKARKEFDWILVRHAVAQGARFFSGVDGLTCGIRAQVSVAADGNSSRLAVAAGIRQDPRKPMGVAARAYYRSPKGDGDMIESWLELRDGKTGELLPGYGWAFPLGDGRCNVGLGTLLPGGRRSRPGAGKANTRELLGRWLADTPGEWGFSCENQEGEIGSAALPMCLNRRPIYKDGLLLVGDAAGMVSPFNGEGIAYALEAASWAAEAIVDAKARGFGTPAAERALRSYPARAQAEWSGYLRLGEVFAKLITRPRVLRACVRYGLPRPTLMRLTNKLLAHLYDQADGDWMDRAITLFTKLASNG